MALGTPELRHLKRVSRIKHLILTRYLPSWATILGSTFDLLYYVDCFAGPGRYESDGERVDGSAVLAVKAGKEFAARSPRKKLGIVLVDDDQVQLKQLEECLRSTLPYPGNFEVRTRLADSHTLIPKIIGQIRKRQTAPSFFLVDPYGHPLSLPVMNDMLALPRSELLINFMWYAKRFGAAYSDAFIGNFFGNAVLPIVLHEDPWYFQKGTGSKTRRFLWAASSTVWCKRDKGGWGPNYANVGGNLIGSAIARAYYPAPERTVSDTITDGLTVSAEGIVGAEVIEFWPDIERHFKQKHAETLARRAAQRDALSGAHPASPSAPVAKPEN
jgi:hypothetical protein